MNHVSKTPAYMCVYKQLKRKILDSEYEIGELLPPEPVLEKMFAVSRTTVRRAVELLMQEGFVRTKQGRGTEVLNYNTQQSLNNVTSLSETLERKGYTVYSKSMYIDEIAATQKLADELRVARDTKLIRIQRIQMADNSPIAIMTNYINASLVPNMTSYSGKFARLYDFLEEHYGLTIEESTDRITARNATFEEAQMLDVPVGTALVYMRRTCFSNSGVICVDRAKIIADRSEFEIHLKGRMNRL